MIHSTEAVGVYVLSSVVFHNWWAGGRGAWIDGRNKYVKTENRGEKECYSDCSHMGGFRQCLW